ncbi:hypothetical protein TNCV_3593751 [Trichonephila clavipes]|nr:hypothetical protein TNCV_3593751 [Trichonephila clavipes]
MTPAIDSPAPSDPFLHPLASQFQRQASNPSTSDVVCFYCDKSFNTQKGLNSHLVRIQRYGVSRTKKAIFYESADTPIATSHGKDHFGRCHLSLAQTLQKRFLLPRRGPPAAVTQPTETHHLGATATDRLRYDAAEASRTQRAYKSYPKKTVESILGGNSSYCEIAKDSIVRHFLRPLTGATLPLTTHSPHILNQRRTNFSSLHSLRLKFGTNWPTFLILPRVLMDLTTVPRSWKNSRVVLIHKGDPLDITNWCPISLLNTIGKIFSTVIASRLSSWATINNRLSE